MNILKFLRSITLFVVLALSSLQMTGCASIMATIEGGAESLNPTVMASLDSFESAAMSIKLSNRVLQDIPLSQQDEWPLKLQGKTSGAGAAKMGAALIGSTQGVTIPTEMDKETGLPRPTSAFYLFLKERDETLTALKNKDDIAWFKKQPKTTIHRAPKSDPTDIDKFVYRNTLMAYGQVTKNKQSVLEMQEEVDRIAGGFKTCSFFLNTSTTEVKDEKIIKQKCPDSAVKDDDVKSKLAAKNKAADKSAEKAEMEKTYGKLANKVYKASVAGADFTAAAVIKIGFAIANGVRALPNIQKEFSGLKGAYNTAVLIPRTKNIFNSLGLYKNNLGFQWTVYKTMYQQINDTYEIKDDEQTKQALLRIKAVEIAMAELEPKIQLALADKDVSFTNDEINRLNLIAAMFPTQSDMEQTLVAALHD